MVSNLILPYPPSFTEAQSVSKSGQGEERKGQNRRRTHSETPPNTSVRLSSGEKKESEKDKP